MQVQSFIELDALGSILRYRICQALPLVAPRFSIYTGVPTCSRSKFTEISPMAAASQTSNYVEWVCVPSLLSFNSDLNL